MAGGEHLGEPGQLFDVGSQLLRPERAVESHGERAGMPHRVVERLGGLAGKRASRGVGDRAGDDDGQPHAAALESLLNGKERRLGIERIEHRFQEEQVDAALEQPVERFVVGRDELIEADRAKARIVDIGRDRCGLVGRPEHASHETASRASSAAARLSSRASDCMP